MSLARCPHCEQDIQYDALGPNRDCWYYVNDLYNEDTKEVPCPYCNKLFEITTFLRPYYVTNKIEG